MQLVLSTFTGAGLLDMAFEEEGFCVVSLGDIIFGRDIRKQHVPSGKFDGVIGGPPCQTFSRLAYMVRQNGYEPKFGNLIPEFERLVSEAQPQWWVMENVPDAPRPKVEGYGIYECYLNLRWCEDANGKPCVPNRLRAWTFGFKGERRVLPINTVCFEAMQFEYAATGGSADVPVAIGGSGKPKRSRNRRSRMPFNSKSKTAVAELARKQGLSEDFLEFHPFRVDAACKMLGNGVPLPMGRAIAKAVKEATSPPSVPDSGVKEAR